MNKPRGQLFTLHELLIMAALAALGGVSGSAVSWVGKAMHTVTGIPGGLQFLAGVHVLWLVLAVGLIRKPGAGTLTGLLKGTVELLTGNPHGLLVLLMSGLGGIAVDAVWLLAGRRDRLVTYMLAGGLGAASNLLVFKVIYSLPSSRAVNIGLAALTGVAFISGALLAGLLGWSLMDALRRAGVVGTQRPARAGPPGARTWVGLGVVAAVVLFAGIAFFYSSVRGETQAESTTPAITTTAPGPASGP